MTISRSLPRAASQPVERSRIGLFQVMGVLMTVAMALPAPAALAHPAAADVPQAINAFGLDLFSEVAQTGENAALSPYSVASALAMTSIGARGATRAEIERTLRVPDRVGDLPRDFGRLNQSLQSGPRGRSVGSPEDAPSLWIANSIWGQKGLGFRGAFVTAVQEEFRGVFREADFEHTPDEARGKINGWVVGATHGRIGGLLPAGSVNSASRLVLVNAVYFSGTWATPFPEDLTHAAPFHVSDSKSIDVSMMQRTADTLYVRGESYVAVELPYAKSTLAMLIVLPDAGRAEPVRSALRKSGFDEMNAGLKVKKVRLSLPKFRLEPSLIELSGTLENLGMKAAFSPLADFSGITGETPLAISAVYHKVFVEVDEKGTEAAASTAVVQRVGAAPHPPEEIIPVVVDRPFLFFIRDRNTGTVLFLGRVASPSSPV